MGQGLGKKTQKGDFLTNLLTKITKLFPPFIPYIRSQSVTKRVMMCDKCDTKKRKSPYPWSICVTKMDSKICMFIEKNSDGLRY